MLISGKSITHLPIFTSDSFRYRCTDAVISESGSEIESLYIRNSSILSYGKYVLPVTAIKSIEADVGIYLKNSNDEMAEYERFPDLPDYSLFEAYQTRIHVDSFLMSNLIRFKLECLDEKLGQIRDLYFHPTTFTIPFFAAAVKLGSTKKWAFISSRWLEKIDWSQRIGYLNVFRDIVTSAHLYEPKTEVTKNIEQALYSIAQKIRTPGYQDYYDKE